MEVYTLDNLLRRTHVIDDFESCIWTERQKAYGDFELVIHSTPETKSLLAEGVQLAINESKRVMTIETIQDKKDDTGRSMLSITGRSIEQIMEERVATDNMSGLTANPVWTVTDTPGNIARYVFQKICVEGILSPNDIIPFITAGSLYPAGTIAEPDVLLTLDLEHNNVYEVVKQICEMYGLGFRLLRNFDTSQLYFEIYSGNDRTTMQSSLAPVIFSPDLDNLTDVTELKSIANLKNVAYVFAKNGSAVVYADGFDPTSSGFARRVLMVKVDDTDLPAGAALTALLEQKGREALSEHRGLYGFDGEVPQTGTYRYGIDYELGDLVEMRTDDGATNNMRVTEQIFVSDSQGDRSYPTLTIDLFITPGSWLARDFNEEWVEATDTWATA